MGEIKCAVELISDALVYGSLVKQGFSDTAKKFLKERNQKEFLDLKSITLEDVIKDRKCWIQNYSKSAVESISDALVYNQLKKLGCTNTAKTLLRIRNQPEFLELRGIPRLEYLINDQKGTITKTEVDSVVESISDELVYSSLQSKRCMKTAKRLLKIRRRTKFLDMKGIRLQDLINDQIRKPATISGSIVIENVSNTEYKTVSQTSISDKNKTVYSPSKYHENLKEDNFESMIHDSNDEIEDWESFIQEHFGENCRQDQLGSSIDIDLKEVTQNNDEIKRLPLSKYTLVKDLSKTKMRSTIKTSSKETNEITDSVDARRDNYANKEGKSVLIKDVFKDRFQDIFSFRDDGTEVFKVLSYISCCNAKVMKTQAATVNVRFRYNRDTIQVSKLNRTETEAYKNLRVGSFSLEKSAGLLSEQTQILNAWNELIECAGILDKVKLLRDLENLSEIQWPWGIVGCYVSKYLLYPRFPARVFNILVKFVLYETGRWDKNEEEIILDHLTKKKGSYDLENLKVLLRRPRMEIKQCIDRLLQKREIVDKKGTKFTVDEQMHIFKSAMNGRTMPSSFEDFKRICDQRQPTSSLVEKLDRSKVSISQNWLLFIKPTIYSYLCHKSEFQWKRDFFQYIVDSKANSIQDVNMVEAQLRWPYLTVKVLQQILNGYNCNKEAKMPLYKAIEPLIKTAQFTQTYFDRRKPLIEAFEEWRMQNQANLFLDTEG